MASKLSVQSWIAVVLRKGAWKELKFWMYTYGEWEKKLSKEKLKDLQATLGVSQIWDYPYVVKRSPWLCVFPAS